MTDFYIKTSYIWLAPELSEFFCLEPSLDLSTAADVACDDWPTQLSSRLNIITQLS